MSTFFDFLREACLIDSCQEKARNPNQCCCSFNIAPFQTHLLLNLASCYIYCVRGTRTQPLICVGCSVHCWVSFAINKGSFFEIAFSRRRHTFALLWGAWLRFASLWRTNARGDSWVLGVHQSNVSLSCDNLPSFVAFCWVVIIFHRSSLKRAERLLKGCLLKLLSFKTAQYNFTLC